MLGRAGGDEYFRHRARRDRNAERSGSGGHRSWRAADRRAVDDVHRLARPAADDPEMYKIAGELTPTVFHIAARTIATHASRFSAITAM